MNLTKIRIRLMVLMLVLGVLSTGCRKENVTDGTDVVMSTNSVTYIVNGQQYYANPQTDEEWSAFFDRMFALVEEGYSVRFWRNDARVRTASTKEVIKFSTTSQVEAEAWCIEKIKAGYEVTMVYNQETGEYDCYAVK